MYLNNNPNSHSESGTKGGDKDEKHRKWSATIRPPHRYYKTIYIYITLVIKRTICHFPILTCFISLKTAVHPGIHGKTLLSKWEEIIVVMRCRNQLLTGGAWAKKKKTFSTRLLMNSLFFMSCNGLKFSHPYQLSVDNCSQVTKKEAERGWFSISIVNHKLERVPQFHAMSSHTDGSLWETNLNFEFKHDSRLYEGICVHVCIYLFMCNLTGTVNMVHLLKLLFYLSGASCFSGFEYSLSSLCGFTVLRKQKGFFYFNSALL